MDWIRIMPRTTSASPHPPQPIAKGFPPLRAPRRGAAAIEFAMTAPLLFLMLYAALELGHANMTFHTVEAACYEGARIGIVPGATADQCRNAANRILLSSGVRGATVRVLPEDLQIDSPEVAVEIGVPYAETALLPPTFTRVLNISRRCELVREKP